jgi:hypothetical protein
MIVSPFNNDYVISSFSYDVTHGVQVAALMFNVDFFTRSLRPVNANEQYVSTWKPIGKSSSFTS